MSSLAIEMQDYTNMMHMHHRKPMEEKQSSRKPKLISVPSLGETEGEPCSRISTGRFPVRPQEDDSEGQEDWPALLYFPAGVLILLLTFHHPCFRIIYFQINKKYYIYLIIWPYLFIKSI